MSRIFVTAAAFVLAATLFQGRIVADEPATDIVAPSEEDKRRARVYATIGEKQVTVGELEDEINRRSPFVRRRFKDPEVLQKFVDDHLEAELLTQGALLRGYDKDPQVQRFVGETIAQIFIRSEFDEKNKPEDVSDGDVKAYYKEHPEEFSSPEMRRASHILVGTKPEALELIEQLKNGDAKMFTQLAKDKSLDTETKLRGGDLLFFSKDGRMSNRQDAKVDGALVKAAFKLKEVGNVSTRPVAVGESWSVVKLTGLRKAQHKTLKEASGTIRSRIWRKQRREGLEKLLAELKAELKPESHPERVEPIKLPKPAPGALPVGH